MTSTSPRCRCGRPGEKASRGVPLPSAYGLTPRNAADITYTTSRDAPHWEGIIGIERDATEIVPVCETALGVVDGREIVASSRRIRCALLGSEDLANDLVAERGKDALELDYARRRFILDCPLHLQRR